MKQVVASFDVFDTLITRPYAVPGGSHVHLGELLVEQGLAADGMLSPKSETKRKDMPGLKGATTAARRSPPSMPFWPSE